MDRLESITALLAAIDAGSLSAASRKLAMPLATVSRKVSALEAYLGTTLVRRTSRRLMLTEAGRAYADACRRILEDIEAAERVATGEYSAPRGDLIITAPVVFGRLHVLPMVLEFLTAYPEIDVRLVLADRVVSLLEDHVDLAVRIGALPDSSLVAARVGALRRVVCGSPSYFAERTRPGHPRDLERHVCIAFQGLTAPDSWTFTVRKTAVAVAVHSRLIVNTAEAAIDAAVAGLGVTRVLSYQAAAALRAGSLAIVLDRFEPPPWPVSLVHAAQRPLPLKLRAFLDFAAPRLRAALAEVP
jgi:DNA-binding transcriptional LysR family regulator